MLLLLLSFVYGIFINWHLSGKGRLLPASVLGNVPPNFVSALSTVIRQNLQVSLPMFILVVLFACADFSDSIARLGVTYVPTPQKGNPDTVLTLEFEVR